MKKQYFLIVIFLFVVLLIPKDVFADYEELDSEKTSSVLNIVSDSSEASGLILSLDDVSTTHYFIYYTENSNFSFPSDNYGFSLVGIDNYGLIQFEDLLNVFPYYLTFTDYLDRRYFFFFYDKDVYLANRAYTIRDTQTGADYNGIAIYIKHKEKTPPALAMSFRQIGLLGSDYLYNAYTYYSTAQEYGLILGNQLVNSVYYDRILGDFGVDYSSLEDFINSDSFYSNATIHDINSSNIDNELSYSNSLDISNSATNSQFGELAPKSLGELIASIPHIITELFAAFSIVGVLFTSVLATFPPVITFGLYTIFTLGIVILIIKTLS